MKPSTLTPQEARTYVYNLNEMGREQALFQLLLHPESRELIIKCAKETHKAFSFPVRVE